VGGYYVNDRRGAYMVLPADGRRLGDQLSVVLHEYAHDVFHFTLGDSLPPWLDEGLAELCGSVGADRDGRVPGRYLGRPLTWHVHSLRRQIGLPTAELLNITGAKLRDLRADDTARFYAKSWALVHFLFIGREDRRPGDATAFLAALAAGREPVDAFREAFRLDPAEVDRTLRAYIERTAFPAVRIDAPSGVFGPVVTTEPVLESEVEALQGRLLLGVGAVDEGLKRLSRAFGRNPGSIAARALLAHHHSAAFRIDEAMGLLLPVLAEHPQAYDVRVTLGTAQQRAGRYQDAFDTFTTATRLAGAPSAGALAWYGLSLAAVSLGRTAEADAAMERLQAIDASPGWYVARAWDLWDAGNYEGVVADVQHVLESRAQRVEAEQAAYTAFVGALAARRIGQAEFAAALLDRVDTPALLPWTKTVLSFLRGELPARDFLSKASGRGEQTEARTYIGVTASLAGRIDDAVAHLTWVRDRGDVTYSEYDAAYTELARLGWRPADTE
jgi:tetratricopeptide (TPR) repeat protein